MNAIKTRKAIIAPRQRKFFVTAHSYWFDNSKLIQLIIKSPCDFI